MKQLISLLVITSLSGCFGKESHKIGLEGKPLPNFRLLLTDSVTSLSSNDIPSGKTTVFFYLTPSCSYCKAQTKEIIEDMDKLKDIQFYFVTTPNLQLKDFINFCNQYQLFRYSNIIAAIDTASAIADYFEITNVPYLAIYNKDKTLNKTFLGKIYSSQIKKAAEE
jgi:thiol-disulfide isomerase/thioredoxin